MAIRRRFSKKLSPRAKRLLIAEDPARSVDAQLLLSPRADREHVEQELEALGASLRTWSDSTKLVSLTLEATKLPELARVRGVVYVEIGEPMRLSSSNGYSS